MKQNKIDLLIVGGGPIGLACGIEAERKGLSYKIIEKGCLVNSLFNYPTNMTFFSTSDRLEIGDIPFISHGSKPTRNEALEYYRRVKKAWKLAINTYEKVLSISGKDRNFDIETSKSSYRAEKVIIATGFYDYPNYLNIPGENLSKVMHYYDEPHPYSEQKIVIIGGGNSAVDVALETYRAGSDVTMVIKNNQLDNGIKYWVRPDIENRIEEGSIKSFFNSTVTEITEKHIKVKTPEKEITLENDFVFAMTGYHPDFQFLESIGISYRDPKMKEPYYSDETFESNVKGIYLAGVICSGLDTSRWFIENSRYHAVNIIDHISSIL